MSNRIQNACRLCLSEEGVIPIFAKDDNIYEKIMFCARVKVDEDDGLPISICKICSKKLETSYYFRLQVESSDYKLRQRETILYITTSTEENKIVLNNSVSNENLKILAETDAPKVKDAKNLIDDNDDMNMDDYIKIEDGHRNNKIQKKLGSKTETNDSYGINREETEFIDHSTKLVKSENQINLFVKTGEQIINKSFSKKKPRPHQCETCGKTFKRSTQLKVHMLIHTEEKEFSCSVCFKKFRLKHHLKGHYRIHTLDKPFKCLHCGKCFTENSSLSRHIKIHTNDKKYSCQQCGKQFIASAEVRKHMVRHTGEKPFSCKLCNKNYSDASSLHKHKKTHKNDLTNNEKHDN